MVECFLTTETLKPWKDLGLPSFAKRVRTLEGIGNRRIGVFNHTEILSHRITIRNFPTRSEPFIWRTSVSRSQGVGGLHHRRNPRQGVSPSAFGVHQEIGDRGDK
jgi:hypothetical protein